MDDPKAFAPELSPAGSRKWIGRLVIAVIVGAAIWNFVASLTVDLIVPGVARIMEADPQSPLYLGKGDIHFAGLFVSVLELCFALIAALIVNAVSEVKPKVRRRVVNAAPSLVPAAIAPMSVSPKPAPAPVTAASDGNPPQSASPQASSPQPSAQIPPAKAEKPSKPKKVYYNLVGERVEEDE